jgi:hypothetical protein
MFVWNWCGWLPKKILSQGHYIIWISKYDILQCFNFIIITYKFQ